MILVLSSLLNILVRDLDSLDLLYKSLVRCIAAAFYFFRKLLHLFAYPHGLGLQVALSSFELLLLLCQIVYRLCKAHQRAYFNLGLR